MEGYGRFFLLRRVYPPPKMPSVCLPSFPAGEHTDPAAATTLSSFSDTGPNFVSLPTWTQKDPSCLHPEIGTAGHAD